MSDKIYHVVYMTTNNINKMFYVGKRSTDKLDEYYLGSGKYLKRAVKKYGKENFTKTILHIFLTEAEAYECERNIVDEDFVSRPDTYNMKCGGEGGLLGYKATDETKEKQRQARLANPTFTKELWERNAIANTGTPHSEEHKNKISQSLMGNTYGKGIPQTPDSIEKRRKANTGKKRTPEQCKAISEGKKLKYQRDKELGIDNSETGRKISKANKGRVHSESTKQKMSESHLEYHKQKKEHDVK